MASVDENWLAEEIAGAAAALYHGILDSFSVGAVAVDADDLIVYANEEACRLLGFEPAELIGNSITLLLPGIRQYASIEPGSGAVRSLVGTEIEASGRRKDGSDVSVALSVRETPVRSQTLYTAAVQDISERLRYEEALIAARNRAEEMARLRSTILTNVSHEIRTPLTAIRGFAKVLLDEVPTEQREFVELIETNSQRLLDTLQSVLELSRLDAAEVSTTPSDVDLVAVAEEVAATLRPAAKSKGIEIILKPAQKAIPFTTDVVSLNSILYNLVGNAVKFTDEGHVTVSVRDLGVHVEIVVEDTGIGIDDEFLSRMFDEFTQESTGLTRDYEGTGLGLAITKRAVDLLGGSIDVQSRKRDGTRFTVQLQRTGSPTSASASRVLL